MAQKDLKNGTLWRERQGIVKNGFFWKTHLSNCDQKIEFRAIQTDSGSKPGDSGGPVVSEQGQLVGVNSCNNDKGDYAVDVNEVRLFLARWTPAPNLPPPPKGVAGTWTVSWKHKDQELCAGLTLNADGTGHWDGGKLCPGTYVYDQGKLTLQMPGSGVNATAPLVWESHNSFRFTVQFTDGAIEFVATRR
jgi:hypothetical protein